MPKISIIIPTYNRPGPLTACLESLARLRYPREQFEVIVVDDGGSLDLGPIIDPLRDVINIGLITQENTGPAGARNKGAANAKGEFIAFTDDDCVPQEDWLAIFVQHLQQDPAKMYGGHTVNLLENNIYSTASQALIDYLYGYYNSSPGQAHFCASNNMAVAKKLFDDIKGFDSTFPGACGEDRELCDRWLHSGRAMSYIAEAKINHNHNLSFNTFLQQHFNYGTGALRFRQARTARGQKPQRTEPPAFYFGLVSYAWKKRGHRPLSLSALLVLSQVANVAGFTWAKLRL